jgi:putative transposase
MARRHPIGLRDRLATLLPKQLVRDVARETDFVVRIRKILPEVFVWTLALGFACGSERTIAGLRRAYELATGASLVPSAFYDRFDATLVQFLRRLVALLLDKVTEPSRALAGALDGLKALVVTDSTVIRLRELLAGKYPGSRTNHSKAAMKLHVVLGAGRRSIKVTSGRANDGKTFSVGPWVRDSLLLFDLGYFKYQLFDCIRRNGGFFVSRMKKNANPKIVAIHRKWRGRSVPVVGERLLDVLKRLQRQILDVEIEVDFKRRAYDGKRSGASTRFRLVGVLNEETKEYHLYITNLPGDRFPAAAVARIYRARWTIELLFKSLKSDFALEDMPSESAPVVEALLYATILTWLASQELLAAVRARLKRDARRATDRRWTRLFRAYALQILQLLVGPPSRSEQLACVVERTLLYEALDPHLNRASITEVAENGATPTQPASLAS